MGLLCRCGFHKWHAYSTSEVRNNIMYVYTWNFCEREGCYRYSMPTLMDVTKVALARY